MSCPEVREQVDVAPFPPAGLLKIDLAWSVQNIPGVFGERSIHSLLTVSLNLVNTSRGRDVYFCARRTTLHNPDPVTAWATSDTLRSFEASDAADGFPLNIPKRPYENFGEIKRMEID